jgi:Ger(x)C family germination protein
MKNSKRYKLLLIILSMVFLCGCWDIKDINKRLLPLVMGISKEDNGPYKVTLQIPILKQSDQTSRIISDKGDTVANVLQQIGTNSEDVLDYSQIRLIVIQKDLAENYAEFKKLVEFLMVTEDIPNQALIAVTNENVRDVLSNINNKLSLHSSSLYDYFHKGAGWAPDIYSVTVWEVFRSNFTNTRDMLIPIIRSGKDTVLAFEGSSILKKGKSVSQISPDDSQIIRMLRNKNARGKVESLRSASVVLITSSMENNTALINRRPSLTSTLKLKIRVLERKEGVTNDTIQQELEQLIEQRFYDLFQHSQKIHTDVFGFGQLFQQYIPYHDLKNWRDRDFPHLKVNFKVQSTME